MNEQLRYLEARTSAARLIYQETGKLAVKQSLELAQQQLEEYKWSHPYERVR